VGYQSFLWQVADLQIQPSEELSRKNKKCHVYTGRAIFLMFCVALLNST